MKSKKTILIVEDVKMNRKMLGQMFQNAYAVAEAENGQAAIEYLTEKWKQVIMVLLDIKMPVLDGFGVMEQMRENGWMKDIPVILITGDEEGNAMERGYALGASDVIFKPFKKSIVVQRVANVIELYQHKNHLEEMVKRQTAELNRQYDRLKTHHEHLVAVLHDIINYRRTEPVVHVRYVQEYTRILATHYAGLYPRARMTQDKIHMIVRAAQMHDVGKITMPDTILRRPGRLSESDMLLLQEHTIKGSQIMRVMTEFESEEYVRICCNVCLYHHERYEGNGFPAGLKKDRIPLEAQLVGLADMYDVLIHSDMGRKAVTKGQAYMMLMNGECGELSPRMKECLEDAREDLEAFKL